MEKIGFRSLVIGLCLIIGIWSLGFVIGGCGQQQAAETPAATAASVVIKGGTSNTTTQSLAVGAQAALVNAEVTIGTCQPSSDAVTIVARGTTDSDGNYSISCPIASLESVKSGSYAANLVVTCSKEGVVVGCIIPSTTTEANQINYAPRLTQGAHRKALIARAVFKKGMDPKNFDFNSSVDQKFSNNTIKDWDDTKVDNMADSIKGGEDAEEKIAQGLGISVEVLAQLKRKGMELHQLYIEPIFRRAFENKTEPDRATLDLAFTSLEAAMKDFAITLGVNLQQFSDLRAVKDKQMETTMGGKFTGDDPAFREVKRRGMGTKVISLFVGQWDAANAIATIAPSGKQSYKDNPASSPNYLIFVTSREAIIAQLNAFLNTANTSPEAIPRYLHTGFFEAFLYSPATERPSMEGGRPNEADMEAKMAPFTNNRIMVYFMQAYLNGRQRMTYFTSQESAMQPIFQRRFNKNPVVNGVTEATSPYYMGPEFWATRPTPQQIQDKLALFDAALDAAMDNNAALKAIFIAAGFTDAQATTILKAFRILMSPPDMMI